VIIDEIHLLGVDRGPVFEVIVSRMRYIAAQTRTPIRFVGLSTALANAGDLGDWLGIAESGGGGGAGGDSNNSGGKLYNFRASVRPVPMTIHIRGFPEKNYCPRMATMNKPAYAAIMEHSPKKPVLIFVSSRRQTRLTALDLISYCAAADDEESRQFLHMSNDEAENISSTLTDQALQDCIVFGIGIHHAGLSDHDRKTSEQLFCNGKIQVLVCTSTLAWGVNFPAHLVIVKGTEFFDGKIGRYVDFPVTDVLQMMGRAGRPQFDDSGVACIFVHEPKKTFYKRFLHEPFPVESSLHNQMHNHISAEVASESVTSIIDCVEWISYTYLFRRLVANPCYYGLASTEIEVVEAYLTSLIENVVTELVNAGCVSFSDEFYLSATPAGAIASFYYLDWRSVAIIKKQYDIWKADGGHDEGNDDSASLRAVLRLVSDCQEFAELPVRHNEDELNEQLSEDCPWEVDPDTLDSSHTKTFLLLQAHIYRKELPISDYINDTKSVLDQSPRVLSALMDIAVEWKLTRVVQHCIIALQCIIQALPPDANTLLQLPGTTTRNMDALKRIGITNLNDLSLYSNGDSGDISDDSKEGGDEDYEAMLSHTQMLTSLNRIDTMITPMVKEDRWQRRKGLLCIRIPSIEVVGWDAVILIIT
jgi:activating signal cointegrator complex subunit 3